MKKSQWPRVGIACFAFLISGGVAAAQTTIYVNPSVSKSGNGTMASPYKSWTNVRWAAGNSYLQAAGTAYSGNIQPNSSGTSGAHITIGTYGSGNPPGVTGMIVLSGVNYVDVNGYSVTNPSGAGLILQNGSSHDTVSNMLISNSEVGIWAGNNVGGSNTIFNNSIINSLGEGIGVDHAATSSGNQISLTSNYVSGSGFDGIEITSNYVQILNNIVVGNGSKESGTSGIHLYASGPTDVAGSFNSIIGNISVSNIDSHDQDGNGIEADQWTHNNVISQNLAISNDGAGIALYDSYSNTVSGNVLGANANNSGGTHSILADFIFNQNLNDTYGNAVSGNTVLAFLPKGSAVYIAAGINKASNVFSKNIYENLLGPSIYSLNGAQGHSLSQWNATVPASDAFSGVSISTPNGTPYAYTFPPGTDIYVDGRTIQLTGWTPSQGLWGKQL